MFANFKIKQEIVDNSYDQNCDQMTNVFSYESNILAIKSPPKKKIKVETEIRDPRLLKHRLNNNCLETKSEPKVECKQEIGLQWYAVPKQVTKSEDKTDFTDKVMIENKPLVPRKCFSATKTFYDNVLQEIFQWSPEWLQGSVEDKPPFIQLEKQMKQNVFKHEYSGEEYISRQLPFIMRELFIKLSDTFKNEAPSRSEHLIFINDCENTGHLQLNRLLVCYVSRDTRSQPKPFTKINDIITISLNVMTGKVMATKKYFGIIYSHSMLEINDMDAQVIRDFEKLTNTNPNRNHKDYLLWDRYSILTKRAQNSLIVPKRLAKMDVLLSAGIELRVIQNLLDRNLKSTKLMANILSANANIHQFSNEELKDFMTIRKTLSKNAVEMIVKCNPMVFFKGLSNLMVVDINDSVLRMKYLCEIILESIYATNSGKLRVLVITSNDQLNSHWAKRLRTICSCKSVVRSWYMDKGQGWTRHMEVTRFVTNGAKKIYESLAFKLKYAKESDDKVYKELLRRKRIYHEIKSLDFEKSKTGSILCQTSPVLIAKEELYTKGFIQLLNDSNVIIGTFYDVLNSQQLFTDSSKPFDCCIIDDCHLLADAYIMSIIHLGVNTIIIGGDSEHRTGGCEDSFVKQHKYDSSLFDRIVKKDINFS